MDTTEMEMWLAQNRVQWRTMVTAALTFVFCCHRGNFKVTFSTLCYTDKVRLSILMLAICKTKEDQGRYGRRISPNVKLYLCVINITP
jgi:hypothetical protein